jgi:hypothetical protein
MSMRRYLGVIVLLLAGAAGGALAQDQNVLRPVADLDARLEAMPFEIRSADKARGVAKDTALKSEVHFADGVDMRIKIRPAFAGGAQFNNEPRYELAAYRLQAAFLDEPDYVVPPTALRALPLNQLLPFAPTLVRTFREADDVVVVVQYWLKQVAGPEDAWDPARFDREADYAHHMGDANVLTYLIKHGDSNKGNLMVSTVPGHARVFDIDNGVAFRSEESDRGSLWKNLRVPKVPAQAIARLRTLDLDKLEALLTVMATWEVRDGHLVALPGHAKIPGKLGVRHDGTLVQLGLTQGEIADVERRRKNLLALVDKGKLGTF